MTMWKLPPPYNRIRLKLGLVHQQMKNRLNPASVYHHSVQRLPSSRLFSTSMRIKTMWIIIVPFVAYRCKNWSVTLTEECRLRAFENRELRKIFGPKKAVVKARLGSVQNGDPHDCCCSQSIIRVTKSRWMRWAEHAGSMGKRADP